MAMFNSFLYVYQAGYAGFFFQSSLISMVMDGDGEPVKRWNILGRITIISNIQDQFSISQWIGLRENLQESPIFDGKIYGFL